MFDRLVAALAIDSEALYKPCLDHLHIAHVGEHTKRRGSAGTRISGLPQR